MSALNPNIPSTELSSLMTDAAGLLANYSLKLLTPQLLLRVFLEEQESAAYQILQRLHKQRGADFEDLLRRVEMMARSNKGRNAKFDFTDDFGKDIPLDEEMLVVIEKD